MRSCDLRSLGLPFLNLRVGGCLVKYTGVGVYGNLAGCEHSLYLFGLIGPAGETRGVKPEG